MSRRKAEEEIRNGKVLVNNQKAEIGQKVDPNSDAVTYEGRLVEPCENKVYIKLNKPRGYVATLSDEKGRKCIGCPESCCADASGKTCGGHCPGCSRGK